MPLAAIDLQTVANEISYWEHGDLEETWAPDGAELTRVLRCRWRDRFAFVADMLGYTENAAAGDLWVRHVPETYNNPALQVAPIGGIPSSFRAVSCTLRDRLGIPGQDVNGVITYYERDGEGEPPAEYAASYSQGDGYAVYSVRYRTVMFDVTADGSTASELDRYVIRRPKFAIENLTLPSQSFKWGAAAETGQPAGAAIPAGHAGAAVAGDLTKPFPTMALTYEWLQIPRVPNAALLAHQGKVNSAAFDASFGNYPAETLLFNSVELRPVTHGTGHVYWDVVYQFLFRPSGWNKIFKPGASYGAFYKVVNKNAALPAIYDTYDFANLFKASSF